MKGKLVILSGPSGVGKDTVLAAWSQIEPRVVRVVAYTTRKMRPGEVDGFDYHFVDRSTFLRMVEEGAFLEHKEVHGNLYATPKKDMEAHLDQGKIAVLKIDVQGALTAMALRPDATSIFLLPPSMEVLEQRIRGRGADDEATIQRRLENAKTELSFADRYQHRIVNDDLMRAVGELASLVGSPEAKV